jgi:MFS family permease
VSVQAPALRPLGIGEILDVGIKIYFRNAWTLFRLVLFVVLPAQILVAIIQASALPAGSDTSFGFNVDTSASDGLSQEDTWTAVIGFLVATIIGALAGKLAQAGCFRAVTDAYLGEQVRWRSSLRYALRRLPAVVGLSIVSTIVVAIGVLLCVLPGVYLWASFYVAMPVLLVEGVGPFRALGRSRELVRGRWWGTFGVALLGTLLAAIIGGALTALFVGLSIGAGGTDTVVGFTVNVLATTLSSVITTPAVAAFAIVLYIDLRVRKEGFDLYLLAQRLGVEPGNVESSTAALLPPEVPTYTAKPPFWPPPPGWQPPGEPPPEPEPDPNIPPYWPPPPGWKPGGGS